MRACNFRRLNNFTVEGVVEPSTWSVYNINHSPIWRFRVSQESKKDFRAGSLLIFEPKGNFKHFISRECELFRGLFETFELFLVIFKITRENVASHRAICHLALKNWFENFPNVLLLARFLIIITSLCFPALHLTPRLLNIAISRRENINFSSFAFIHYVLSS